MDDSSQQPWSNNPNAPQIAYPLYIAEKANFAGFLIGTIFYGTPTYTTVDPFSHSVACNSRRRDGSVLPGYGSVQPYTRNNETQSTVSVKQRCAVGGRGSVFAEW